MGSILVADDNELCRELMKGIIEKQGHDVIEAKDGLEAVEIVKKQKIDLIFMDCSMPRMSGVEATKKIRESHSIEIIGVSSNGPDFAEECLCAGMNSYTSKPVNFDVIRMHIKKFSGNSS